MRQVGPVISSKSSLNHLTLKGGVPLNVPLKRTVALGTVAWDSGRVTKLGGSAHKEMEQALKAVLKLRIKLAIQKWV